MKIKAHGAFAEDFMDYGLMGSLDKTIDRLTSASAGAPYDEKVLGLYRAVDLAVKMVHSLRTRWGQMYGDIYPVSSHEHWDILVDKSYKTKVDQLMGKGGGMKRKEVPN